MRAAVLWIALPLLAQDAPKAPPTPREKARELLTRAGDMTAAASPEIQVAALIHLGDTWIALDKKKSLESFEQALAALPSAPKVSGGLSFAERLLRYAAEADAEFAASLLPSIPDPPPGGVARIVAGLITDKKLDRAIEVLQTHSATGPYPYAAVSRILKELPPDDDRRLSLFGGASSAFLGRPNVEAFSTLLAANYETLPQGMVEPALRAILDQVLKHDDSEESYRQTLSNEKGSVGFSSRTNARLFNVYFLFAKIDPKRAEELLQSRPELAAALKAFPEGRRSMGENVGSNTSSQPKDEKPDPQQAQRMNLDAISETRAGEARAAFEKNPARAVEIAKTIPAPYQRASLLADFASRIANKDPERAGPIIDECLAQLKEINEPVLRIDTWIHLAEAAHRAKRDDQSRAMFDKALIDAEALYKRDTDAEKPNRAMRDEWPSTQSFRKAVYFAAKLHGIEAESMLVRIQDPGLSVLAAIELARGLLNRPGRADYTSVNR